MDPILKEPVINSVNSFITGLNDEQLDAFCMRMVEKQPHIFNFYHVIFHDASFVEYKKLVIFLFVQIIRCYEYQYGDLPMISQETVENYAAMQKSRIYSELKRNSREKVVKTLRRDARQHEFTAFLDEFVDSSKAHFPDFPEAFFQRVKLSNYLVLDMMNEVVQKNDSI